MVDFRRSLRVFHGSSSGATISATASPGPVATMRPLCTCCVSRADAGKYNPTRVRSSPSSGVISTRSPTRISCFFGNSMSGLGTGVMYGNEFQHLEPAGDGRQPELHFVTHLPVGEGAPERGRERDVPGID